MLAVMKMVSVKVEYKVTRGVSVSVMLSVKSIEWNQADCLGMDTNLFFMSREELQLEGMTYQTLRRVCSDCPIRKDCLEYAFKYERHGMFGGVTGLERDLIRRKEFNNSVITGLLRDMAHLNLSLNSILEFIGAESDFIEPRDYVKGQA